MSPGTGRREAFAKHAGCRYIARILLSEASEQS